MNGKQTSKWLAGLRSVGPYLLIELFLPGGTLLALLLWLAQRSSRGGNEAQSGAASGYAAELVAEPQGEPAVANT